MIPPLDIAVNIEINAQAITAAGVAIVAVLTAYGTLKQRHVATKVEEVAAARAADSVLLKDTHRLVNGHTTALEEINKALRIENAALRAGENPPASEE